jgi:flagellar basal body P-ring formation protein FlgA
MIRTSCALLGLTLSPSVQAQALADLAAIDAQVATFTGAAIGEPGGAAMPTDRRLRLRPCPSAPALDWFGARRDMVQVTCPAPGGWRIYVPLRSPSTGAAPATPLIARGDAVSVTVSGDGFAISQQGEALEAGAAGAWIKVRLAGAKADPVRAQVLRPGAVGIDLP